MGWKFWKKQEHPNIKYTQKKWTKESPIYYVTAPFGVLFRKTSGSGAGDCDYGFSFSVTTTLQEVYIIKYFDGNRLKTATEEAEYAKVVVDGKFCYEQRFETFYENGKETGTYERGTVIHLPKLPNLGKSMTEKFEEPSTA